MSTITGESDESADEPADESPDAYEHSRIYRWLDDRLDFDDHFLGKAFPEDRYASFLLGEVSLFSFAILVLTGTFLGLLYNPSVQPVTYNGQVAAYSGSEVPAAFASVLAITYDVRFGMFVRYLHHWASYLFISAMALHMFRVFFSGAYRNPREINWMVGGTILFISMIEGVFGYALPYDEFSATATGIAVEIASSIPFVGDEVVLLVFGGHWPAHAAEVIPRLFFLHVFLVPLLIGGLIGLHLLLLVRQKHTEQAGARDAHDPPADDQSVVVGTPLFPNQVVVTLVVFLATLGVTSLLAGFFPVQRIAIIGPSNPTETPAQVGPDWYLLWTYGLLKMMPSYYFGLSELLGGISLSEFLGGVFFPGLIGTVLIFWPFIDYSDEAVHFTADPIRRPIPTAVGVGGFALVTVLSIAGMDNTVTAILNGQLGLGLGAATIQRLLQGMILVVPPVWTLLTYVTLTRYGDGEDAPDPSRRAAGEDTD